MEKSMTRYFLTLLNTILLFTIATCTVAAAMDLEVVPKRKDIHPKIESRLQALEAAS
jgi:hypothetical protein